MNKKQTVHLTLVSGQYQTSVEITLGGRGKGLEVLDDALNIIESNTGSYMDDLSDLYDHEFFSFTLFSIYSPDSITISWEPEEDGDFKDWIYPYIKEVKVVDGWE